MGNDRRKKKKQQSSSRRDTTQGNSSGLPNKAIGCMSGLLQLFSRHHSRHRIPSAARKESIDTPKATLAPALSQPEFTEVKIKQTLANGDARISGGDDGLACRSPTLPLEIRRSGCCFDHVDSPRRSSALLARLMGLEQLPPPPPTAAVGLSVDSAEEKRRTLLGALERCDEDLRALKLIIDAIWTVEMRRSKAAGEPSRNEIKCQDNNGEQPSPVSVLDALWSPKSRSSESASSVLIARPPVPVFSEVAQKKTRSSFVVGCSLKRRMLAEIIPRQPAEHKGVKDHAAPAVQAAEEPCGILWQLRWRRSHSVVESVDDMRKEALFEDGKEGATVIAELADNVAVDVVNGLVMELVQCCPMFSLQRRGCKRKLFL